jgi:8-oxo-dGTP pyrophosphatase MutT (NUDIX family)
MWADMSPKEEEWLSGQGNYRESQTGIRTFIALCHETGIAVVTYAQTAFYGPKGFDWARQHPEWLAYELPPSRRREKTGRGQVQKWFLYRFLGTDDDIDLAAPTGGRREFRDFRWMDLAELAEEIWAVKRPVYRALASAWQERLTAWAEPLPGATD